MIPISLYAIGGLGLAVVLVGGYAALEHSWRQNAEIISAQEQEANKKNQETISLLKTSVETANKITMELMEHNSELIKQKEDEDAAITDLVGSDEEVRKFLATPVPLKLRCLWGDAQCPAGNTNPNGN